MAGLLFLCVEGEGWLGKVVDKSGKVVEMCVVGGQSVRGGHFWICLKEAALVKELLRPNGQKIWNESTYISPYVICPVKPIVNE
ncbi:hypothetical protein EBO34_17260 [Alteribacter keqinensis]|uniref:Uncharacterized protein n=1 Tax=Alteribacter keqinensis TaxID=2483800 RepID=A0A3M7TPK0_9BACI|nr:hypothetical protein EBO34_17260 [Alteribacter keqinensis]